MSEDFSAENLAPSTGSQSTNAIATVPPRTAQVPAVPWGYGPPAIPEIVHAKPGPVELLHALRRRWMTATGLGLLVGGTLAALVWFVVPIRYEVVALLRVMSNPPKLMSDGRLSNEGGDYEIYKRTQAALFKSSFVLQATLRKPEVNRLQIVQEHKDEILDWLSSQLIVEYPGDAEIMRVSMRGDRPDQLKTIVNAVKESYMDEIVNAERAERMRQRDVLERLFEKNRNEVREKLDALYQLHKKFNTATDADSKLKMEMARRQLDSLITQRQTLQTEISALEMRILLLNTRADKMNEIEIPDFIIDHQLATDPQIQQLRQAIANAHEFRAEQERRSRDPSAPSLVRLNEQITKLEELLANRREELKPLLIQLMQYNSQGARPNEFVPLMETERDALLAKLDKLNETIQEQMKALQEMGQFSSDIELRTADLKALQDVTQKMDAELKMWAADVEARPRVQSIEDANVPSGNDATRKYVAVGFAGITGFGAVLFCVALLEFQSRRLNTEADVRDGLGIRVIGHLPALSARAWRRIADESSSASAHLQTLLTESVDSIRATLMHCNAGNPPRVVMVSSPDQQEGKTTVASQLAASLARAGRRTLLVDGDLRNPTAHVVFGLPLDPGFAEVLRGEAEREAAVYATPANNLWLMPAGQFDPSAVQAISGDALIQLVKSLKESYDFVVFDAPPVLKVADPLIFGQCVDAAVLSVRRDVSRIPKIYEACESLRSVGVKVLGAIVNGVNEKPMKRPAPIHV